MLPIWTKQKKESYNTVKLFKKESLERRNVMRSCDRFVFNASLDSFFTEYTYKTEICLLKCHWTDFCFRLLDKI